MKYLKYIALFMASVLTLTSCSKRKISSDIPDIAPCQPDEGDGYKKVSNFSFGLKDVNKSVGMYNLSSKGTSKILVVPVMVSGGPSWSNKMLTNLKNGFFGKEGKTGWQSVTSFYQYSSFGNLEITGEVAPVLKSKYTAGELTSFKNEYNVVDLPQPVGPVSRIIPCGLPNILSMRTFSSSVKPRSPLVNLKDVLSSTLITNFSPKTVGNVETRKSNSLPPTIMLIRPS